MDRIGFVHLNGDGQFEFCHRPRDGRRTSYNESMVRKLEAVYEGGVLRPVEPLLLDEHQQVSVIILDDLAGDGEELEFAPPEEFEALADHSLTLEEVRRELAQIPGSLDADFAAERNER